MLEILETRRHFAVTMLDSLEAVDETSDERQTDVDVPMLATSGVETSDNQTLEGHECLVFFLGGSTGDKK